MQITPVRSFYPTRWLREEGAGNGGGSGSGPSGSAGGSNAGTGAAGSGSGDGTGGGTGNQSGQTFSQAEVDRIVGERLARERTKYADYDQLKDKAAKFDEAQQASKSDLEKANERAEAAERRVAEAEEKARKAEIGLLRTKVAQAKNLSPALAARLRGDTEEEIAADADDLLASLGSAAGSNAGNGNGGGNGGGQGGGQGGNGSGQGGGGFDQGARGGRGTGKGTVTDGRDLYKRLRGTQQTSTKT